MKVSKWFRFLAESSPLDSTCLIGRYNGKTWREICKIDPEWILNLITASRILLDKKLEKKLIEFLREYHKEKL